MKELKEDYLKYKICDSDRAIEIKFLKDYEEYKAGDRVSEGIFINDSNVIYRIDSNHNLKMINGKILEDYIVRSLE